jgi:hypothetical protein
MTRISTAKQLDILHFMDDPQLCGPHFAGPSWDHWRALLKCWDALPMNVEEVEFVQGIAGGRAMPVRPVREFYAVAGRRGAKSAIASLVGGHAAATFSQGHRLRAGERALVLCLATDREQAKIVLNYMRGLFADVDLLRNMVEAETQDGFKLRNRVDIVVGTNSFRSIRGRAVLLAVLDECAFWRDENSATPDVSVYQALKPALATLNGRIVAISTPHKKSGLLYSKFKDHFAQDGDTLVIVSPTRLLNPLIDQQIIDDAIAEDGPHGRAEWLAEWRADVSQYLDRTIIEAAVDSGVVTRPPIKGVKYVAFHDPAGGAGGDSATLAICHRDGERGSDVIVVDCLLEQKPPFDPLAVSRDWAAVIRNYNNLGEVTGDRYSGDFVVRAFAAGNVVYKNSHLDRSAIYSEAVGIFTSGRARLIDSKRLVGQLAGLESKTTATRSKIDHPPGQHDDLANACCGAMVLANSKPRAVLASAIIMTGPARNIPGSDIYVGEARQRVWDRMLRDAGPT